MSNQPRVPSPNSPREVEDWRIRLAADIGNSLTSSDVLGEDGQIIVTINADGTITISLDPVVAKKSTRRSYYYGRTS